MYPAAGQDCDPVKKGAEMSVIDELKSKIQGYEGYAEAWIVSKKTAFITHGSVFTLGIIVGLMLAKHV